MLKAYKRNFTQRMLIHTKCSRQFRPYAYILELPKRIMGIEVLTLCCNRVVILKMSHLMVAQMTNSHKFLNQRSKLKMLSTTKLFQLDEGFINSILSNRARSHFQIAYGSHIRNLKLKSCLQHIRVKLSLGELMETSGNHL